MPVFETNIHKIFEIMSIYGYSIKVNKTEMVGNVFNEIDEN